VAVVELTILLESVELVVAIDFGGLSAVEVDFVTTGLISVCGKSVLGPVALFK